MRLVALALLLVGCGGAQAASPSDGGAAETTQCAPFDAGCDYCPGAASITTAVYPWANDSMTRCECAMSDGGPQIGMEFQSCPVLASCAHIACMFQHYCANGVGIIPPGTCPP